MTYYTISHSHQLETYSVRKSTFFTSATVWEVRSTSMPGSILYLKRKDCIEHIAKNSLAVATTRKAIEQKAITLGIC